MAESLSPAVMFWDTIQAQRPATPDHRTVTDWVMDGEPWEDVLNLLIPMCKGVSIARFHRMWDKCDMPTDQSHLKQIMVRNLFFMQNADTVTKKRALCTYMAVAIHLYTR